MLKIRYLDIWPAGQEPSPTDILRFLLDDESGKENRHRRPDDCPERVYRFICENCWQYDWQQRKTFEQLDEELDQMRTEYQYNEAGDDDVSGAEIADDEADGYVTESSYSDSLSSD